MVCCVCKLLFAKHHLLITPTSVDTHQLRCRWWSTFTTYTLSHLRSGCKNGGSVPNDLLCSFKQSLSNILRLTNMHELLNALDAHPSQHMHWMLSDKSFVPAHFHVTKSGEFKTALLTVEEHNEVKWHANSNYGRVMTSITGWKQQSLQRSFDSGCRCSKLMNLLLK